MNIAVIGAGSWGTALAGMLAEAKKNVTLWIRRENLYNKLINKRVNEEYLPGVVLPDNLRYTMSLKEAVNTAEIIVLVTPSHAIRETANKIAPYISKSAIIVSAAKGLETNTLKRMSEVIADEISEAKSRIAVLSGPNHAEEVAEKFPSATVVACSNIRVAEKVQEAFMTSYFRVYTNSDILGVELAGALKNIIALGAGIVDGLGFGDNTKAALMTRGLAEIARLGMAMNAESLTFAGLAGVGDLIATCMSKHSRNRWAGTLIAQGKTKEEIQAQTNMVVEGIRSTVAAYKLANQYGVEMPITQEAYNILYEYKSPREAVMDLMNRGRRYEIEATLLDNSDWLKRV